MRICTNPKQAKGCKKKKNKQTRIRLENEERKARSNKIHSLIKYIERETRTECNPNSEKE